MNRQQLQQEIERVCGDDMYLHFPFGREWLEGYVAGLRKVIELLEEGNNE